MRLMLIVGLAVGFRFLEASRRFAAGGSVDVRLVRLLYHGLAVSLGLGMAAFGLAVDWSGKAAAADVPFAIGIVLLFTMVGSFFRGVLSKGAPEVLSWFDPDWRAGVVASNSFGGGALAFVMIYVVPGRPRSDYFMGIIVSLLAASIASVLLERCVWAGFLLRLSQDEANRRRRLRRLLLRIEGATLFKSTRRKEEELMEAIQEYTMQAPDADAAAARLDALLKKGVTPLARQVIGRAMELLRERQRP